MNALQKLDVSSDDSIKLNADVIIIIVILQTLKINIKNIKVGPCTSLDKCAVRKVYMECWKDLTKEEKQAIEDLRIGVIGTLMVFCEGETHYVKDNKGKQSVDKNLFANSVLY